MALTTGQRLDRLWVRLDELRYWRVRETVPVSGWTINGGAIATGGAWPSREGVHRFAATAEVPEHWPLDETRLALDLGGEALVTLNYPNREGISFGVDPYHREFPVRHRQIAVGAEATAREPFGVPVRAPRLNRAELIWIDEAVHRFHLLLKQVAETCAALADHEVIPHLLYAAEAAHRSLDWPSDTATYIARTAPAPQQQRIWELPPLVDRPDALDQGQRGSVVAAHEQLVRALKELQKRFPQQGELLLTGHAHIDLAWLWPYDETRRKMRRTFHTALGLMDASDDYRFNQSTAQYYAQLEEDDPALLQAIKA
ncbi:MAG TPA: alpha-mannosidase, partial [Devosia sp.]|nr:alpha-mannosidase [Devosia sp.]